MIEDTKTYNGHTYSGNLLVACQNGYQQGRADAFNEVITEMCKSPFASEKVSMAKRYIQEQLKEQKNEQIR